MGKSEPNLEPVPADISAEIGPAFRDDESGRVTLSLDGPPLSLPDELAMHHAALRSSSPPAPPFLDAWTADRVRRSSLPPSARVSSVSSSAPANDAPGGEDGEESDLFTLVGRARPTQSFDLVTEMTERFALGDYSGALRAAQLLLGQDAEHALGQHYARESQTKLEEMYTSRLSAQHGVFRVAVPSSDIEWLGLDPQVKALLSLVDGKTHYETLLAHSGMPRLWALRTLVELVDARVIRLV